MLVGMGLGSIATLGFHALVKEPSEEETGDLFKLSSIEVIAINCCPYSNSFYQESKPALPKISVLSWFKNPQLYLVGAIYMSTRLFVNLSQAYIPFYLQVGSSLLSHSQYSTFFLQDSLHEGSIYLAIIPLVMMASSFATSFLTSLANK